MDKMQRILQNRKKTYVEKTPNDVYRDVASDSNLSADEVASIGGVESQHGKFEKPIKGGSARGLFQFQPKTAEGLEEGSSESLSDLDTQTRLMKLYLAKNKAKDVEDAYLKHNLGKRRANNFNDVSDETPIQDVIPSHVIRANPGLYNVKTVGEAREKIKEKLKKGQESADIRPDFLDLFKGE